MQSEEDNEIPTQYRVKRSQEEDIVLFDIPQEDTPLWKFWAVIDTRAGRFRSVSRVVSIHASKQAAENRAVKLRLEQDDIMEKHGGVILSREIHDGVEYGLASFRRFTAIIQYSATIQEVHMER